MGRAATGGKETAIRTAARCGRLTIGGASGIWRLNGLTLFLVAIGYAGLLRAVALVTERSVLRGARRRLVYTLSLAVCLHQLDLSRRDRERSGKRMVVPAYLSGVHPGVPGRPPVPRNAGQGRAGGGATSIADFIGARFGNSRGVATLVTVPAPFGTVRYLALQLRSVGTTYADLTGAAGLRDPMVATALVLALFAMSSGPRDCSARRWRSTARSGGAAGSR